MNKEDIKNIIFIIIAISLAIVAVSFILWLLPIIFVVVIAYFIYKNLKRKKVENEKVIKDEKRKMKD